jgi:hypothetical protein
VPRPTFRVLTVALAAATVLAGPWPASALAGDEPARPSLDRLTTGDRPCDVVTPTPVRVSPTLRAVLGDPGGDRVSAQFEVSWDDGGSGTPGSLSIETTAEAGGSEFSWPVPATVPDGPASWRVRAKGSDGYGPWSDAADQGRCRYVKDTQVPAAPEVTSPDVPLGSDEWVDLVGRYAAFTFVSSSSDVTAYHYSFGGGAQAVARADGPGAPVTVRLTPPGTGVTVLEVQSADAAGNLSAPTRYTLRIASAADSVARWRLDDAAGSLSAAETSGGPSAWAGPGESVAFGAEAPTGTQLTGAVSLDGSYGVGLRAETTAADPAATFSVSAWVRPEDIDRTMTAVSQTGFQAPSDFALGTTVTADGTPSFRFSLPSGSGAATQVIGGTPAPGEWSHLTGVYDPVQGTARLYVDGALAAGGEAAVPSGLPHGYVHIGRELETDGVHWTGPWHGDLADVRVWDRVVLPAEIAGLGHRTPPRTGYWAMNTVRTEGETYTDTPDADGRESLILNGDAHLDTDDPLTGAGSISLDGDGDHLDTDDHQVDTDRGYTVTAQVRLHQWAPERDMALLSQGGDQADAFTLRYRAHGVWEAVFTHADTAEPATTTLTAPYSDGPHTFAVQYDSTAGQVRLFRDGYLADSAPYAASDAWNAHLALQVGRDGAGQGGTHHLDGDVDEVRTYAGVLSPAEIGALS